MIIKSLVIIAFLLIIASLGSALFYMVKNKGQEQSEKTAKALTFRIGLSLTLFILVFIAYATGLIKPQGIGARMQQQRNLQQSITAP
ncbi:MAG: twin transmembrane helix small protein [Methylococcaceae bacterium]|nr:twin transmembrane helix small protein [Methylococcaceae bacterium]